MIDSSPPSPLIGWSLPLRIMQRQIYSPGNACIISANRQGSHTPSSIKGVRSEAWDSINRRQGLGKDVADDSVHSSGGFRWCRRTSDSSPRIRGPWLSHWNLRLLELTLTCCKLIFFFVLFRFLLFDFNLQANLLFLYLFYIFTSEAQKEMLIIKQFKGQNYQREISHTPGESHAMTSPLHFLVY